MYVFLKMMTVQQVTKTTVDRLFFVFNIIQAAMKVLKIMDQVICVFQKMILALTVIKMMDVKIFCVLNFLIHVIQVSKTMDLVIYVFLKIVNVHMDIKMMVEKQLNASPWIKIVHPGTLMMVVEQFVFL